LSILTRESETPIGVSGGGREKDIIGTIAKRQEELTGEKAPAERTVWRYIQLAKELPNEIKTVVDDSFGVEHGVQLLRYTSSDWPLPNHEWLSKTVNDL